VKESVKSFEAAVRLDSNFAQAHAALAKALTFFPWFYGVPQSEVRDTIIHAAQRALALDSALADAYAAIALVYATSGEWDKAVTEFGRALAAEPDNFDVHLDYGRILTFRGDLPEALHQLKQARRLEPVSALVSAWTSYVYFLNGELDSALKESARAARLDSTLSATTNLGALVSLGTGRTDEARRLIAAQCGRTPSRRPRTDMRSWETRRPPCRSLGRRSRLFRDPGRRMCSGPVSGSRSATAPRR
jgi:tetratricopeptide (TPR) repeat protein